LDWVRYCRIFAFELKPITTMEEKNLTPAELFFTKKAEFEYRITEAVKQFAGAYATDVNIAVGVSVVPALANSGDVVDCRISNVTIEAKYSQNG